MCLYTKTTLHWPGTSLATLNEQIGTHLDQPAIIALGDGTICLSEFNASDLLKLGDKFLNRWRQLAEEQAVLGLNPLHLLSGATSDYYAVLLVCNGLASIPVFMSLTASGVSHIVHAVPGDADITDGMMLHDAYLPLEGHCFKRHVRMLRTTLDDFDYRQLLPLPPDWSMYSVHEGPSRSGTQYVEPRDCGRGGGKGMSRGDAHFGRGAKGGGGAAGKGVGRGGSEGSHRQEERVPHDFATSRVGQSRQQRPIFIPRPSPASFAQ